jgi:hypothetical protein
MCAAAVTGMVPAMPSPARTRLTIDLDPWADPIAGVVQEGCGHSRPFAGWIELTRTIEVALQAARQDRPSGPADTRVAAAPTTAAPSDASRPRHREPSPAQRPPADTSSAAVPADEPTRQEIPR